MEIRLIKKQQESLTRYKQQLTLTQQKLIQQSPDIKLQQMANNVEQLKKRLAMNITHILEDKKKQLANNAHVMNAVSPLNTLGRGYSILQSEHGKVVQNATDVQTGEHLTARLKQGQIKVEVID